MPAVVTAILLLASVRVVEVPLFAPDDVPYEADLRSHQDSVEVSISVPVEFVRAGSECRLRRKGPGNLSSTCERLDFEDRCRFRVTTALDSLWAACLVWEGPVEPHRIPMYAVYLAAAFPDLTQSPNFADVERELRADVLRIPSNSERARFLLRHPAVVAHQSDVTGRWISVTLVDGRKSLLGELAEEIR